MDLDRIKESSVQFVQNLFPVTVWIREYAWRQTIVRDLLAALTLSTVVIPQAMAYAMLAGLPPVYGLYTSIVPAIIYSLMTSSKHTNFGTFALVSLLLQTAIWDIYKSSYPAELWEDEEASANPPVKIILGIAWMLSFLTGCFQFVLAVSRIGSIISTKLLSEALVSGLTTASAFHIASSQIKGFFGLKVPRYSGPFNFIQIWKYVCVNIWVSANWQTTLMGICCAALIWTIEILNKKCLPTKIVPSVLITIVLATLVTWLLSLNESIAVIGHVPKGYPPPILPWSPENFEISIKRNSTYPKSDIVQFNPSVPTIVQNSLRSAFLLSILAYVLTISITKFYAKKQNYLKQIKPTFDLVAQSVATIFGVLLGRAYVPCASLSRTAVAVKAGQTSMLASLLCSIFVLICVLFLTDLLYYVPIACLSAVIMMAVRGLIGEVSAGMTLSKIALQERRKIQKTGFLIDVPSEPCKRLSDRYWEAFVWWMTFALVLIIDIDWGLIMAVIVARLKPFRDSIIPRLELVGRLNHTHSLRHESVEFMFINERLLDAKVPETFCESETLGRVEPDSNHDFDTVLAYSVSVNERFSSQFDLAVSQQPPKSSWCFMKHPEHLKILYFYRTWLFPRMWGLAGVKWLINSKLVPAIQQHVKQHQDSSDSTAHSNQNAKLFIYILDISNMIPKSQSTDQIREYLDSATEYMKSKCNCPNIQFLWILGNGLFHQMESNLNQDVYPSVMAAIRSLGDDELMLATPDTDDSSNDAVDIQRADSTDAFIDIVQ